VVGGKVVWRDDHHVASAFAVDHRDEVWKALVATGAFGATS
jgi:hypothetical protein